MTLPHKDVLDQLNRSVVEPEPGEVCLVNFLCNHLGEEYEIFFQPFLNGDRPDIVVMLKNYGVLLIEVKDWDLSNYRLDERKRWIVRANGARTKSPIDQVLQYKENLYNLHIPKLLESKIRNYKCWAVVSCAVYFHCATTAQVHRLVVDPFKRDEKYQKFISYYDLIGNDSLTPTFFRSLLYKRYLSTSRRQSLWFNDSLYTSFHRLLKPPYHSLEEGVVVQYTRDQNVLIESVAREQRIKGVVGSGKTCVLAARAVSAHKRTGTRVLILTYNITLKNYIHDAISKVRADFPWDGFYITNYHNFIKHELNNIGVKLEIPPEYQDMSDEQRSEYWEAQYFSNISLFAARTGETHKYEVILIDEVQDYRYEWLEVLKHCFLKQGGEYVLFGDEKQNIYDLELSERDVRTNIKQRPTRMKQTFRLNQALADTTLDYQKRFMGTKYVLDNDIIVQRELSYGLIEYKEPSETDANSIIILIIDFLARSGSHPNDMAILGFSIDRLREIDCLYRHITGNHTTTMFETEEILRKLIIEHSRTPDCIRQGCRLIKKQMSDTEAVNSLINLWVLTDLMRSYPNGALTARFNTRCDKYKAEPNAVREWTCRNDVTDLLKMKTKEVKEKIRDVRNNKKFHFWGNAGTSKISTIHSFKGWEVETLVVCVDPQYESGDFSCSFDELIYTGFTRARTNLLLINCGNTEHRDALRAVFGSTTCVMPNNNYKKPGPRQEDRVSGLGG